MSITPKYIRRLGLFSDLHCGSPHAPWPKGITDTYGTTLPPSEKQLTLNKYLGYARKVLDEYQVDTILFAGEMIHGANYREGGRMTMTPDLDVQSGACVKLFGPLVEGRDLCGVHGSGYHDSRDTNKDGQTIRALGGQYRGALTNFPIKKTGITAQLVHNTGKGLDTYNKELDAAEGRGELPFHIDLVITGHWHHYEQKEFCNRLLVRLPCWQDWSPWKGGIPYYGRKLPTIGFCVLLIDEDDQMTVIPKLYPRPMVSDALGDGL